MFSSQAERDLWWSKLAQLTSLEREHSPAGASINITYFDNSTNFEHVSYNNYNYDNNDKNNTKVSKLSSSQKLLFCQQRNYRLGNQRIYFISGST